jgi:[ribosomal protein S18]-alanine N-acetyltransferase
MMDLERACPTAAHWTEQEYRQLFQTLGGGPERLVLVARDTPEAPSESDRAPQDGVLFGFLVARLVASEWELENIVVCDAVRRHGVGMRLLGALLARARQTNSNSVFLEVRESNEAARSLYVKAGFKQTGRRKSYYTNPQEDAVLYSQNLR